MRIAVSVSPNISLLDPPVVKPYRVELLTSILLGPLSEALPSFSKAVTRIISLDAPAWSNIVCARGSTLSNVAFGNALIVPVERRPLFDPLLVAFLVVLLVGFFLDFLLEVFFADLVGAVPS